MTTPSDYGYEASEFETRVGESIFEDFVRDHDPADVLRELVQNEYDAEGTKMEVRFAQNEMIVKGNGNPIDEPGWHRLSVSMGTGNISGSDESIPAKISSIGSKNAGLRSLWLFGDFIDIKSDGKKTGLIYPTKTLRTPEEDSGSRGKRGVSIRVRYRTKNRGKLTAFTASKQEQAFNQFSEDLAAVVLKLAQPDERKSLNNIRVRSDLLGREIHWRQSAHMLKDQNSLPRIRALAIQRQIRVTQTSQIESPDNVSTIREIEFQKILRPPKGFFTRDSYPKYFARSMGRVMISLSMRLIRGKLDLGHKATMFYPLGMDRAYTGNCLSVSAPFEVNKDRTDIIDTGNSDRNKWLLDQAGNLALELLTNDWYERFGPDAYLALKPDNDSDNNEFIARILQGLKNEECWPSRARLRNGSYAFRKAKEVSTIEHKAVEGYWFDNQEINIRFLDDEFNPNGKAQDFATNGCGVRKYTLDGLVRLRCAGTDPSDLQTNLKTDELDLHYPSFPDNLVALSSQLRFSRAFDLAERDLSRANKIDLKFTQTTLAADGTLKSAAELYVVDSALATDAPLPLGQRLHPELCMSKVISKLCTRFDENPWLRSTATKIASGDGSDEERKAIYGFVLEKRGRFDRTTLRILRKCPILRDDHDEWIEPENITATGVRNRRLVERALHLPHKGFAKDKELTRNLGFKTEIIPSDLMHYAALVSQSGEWDENLELALAKFDKILTTKNMRDLQTQAFLKSSTGAVGSPENLYLDNPLNRACLADNVPYVVGTRKLLYGKLGCLNEPQWQDIVNNLITLREEGLPVEEPPKLYAALVKSLENSEEDLDQFNDEPIIWFDSHYREPSKFLVGRNYTSSFFESVLIDGVLGLSLLTDPSTQVPLLPKVGTHV